MAEADHSHILTLLADRIEERTKRENAYLLAAKDGTLSYPKVVEIATENLRRISQLPKLPNAGVGVDFVAGLASFGKYFQSMPPSDAEIETAIALSEYDYYAFKALELLNQLTPRTDGPLRQWDAGRLLGTVVPLSKPRGQSAYAHLSRDRAIVAEVTKLIEVGFKPTRNKADSNPKLSGCDIVADALTRLNFGISYTAIEDSLDDPSCSAVIEGCCGDIS